MGRHKTQEQGQESPRKRGAQVGNSNAARGARGLELRVRVSDAEMETLRGRAEAAGMTVARWVRMILDL